MVFNSRLWQWAFRSKRVGFSFGIWFKITVDSPDTPPFTVPGSQSLHLLYKPLDEAKKQIRLLRVHPGEPSNPVEISLVTASLLDAPYYEALSYVWGNYQDQLSLLINGSVVQIHKGLFDAIHTLRSSKVDRLLWADAISINQADYAEKVHQIGFMNQIYQMAERVPVYLGRPSEETKQGMKILRYLMDMNETSDRPPWSYTPLSEVERSVADILNRPWFQRVWTVQEATLAQRMTLVCGDHQVSWRTDLQTMRSIVFRIKAAVISPQLSSDAGYRSYTSTLDWTPILNILETQMRQAARREGVTLQRNLLDVAFDFRHRQSVDRRDKYFAMLGIIENDQGGQLALVPDYSITAEELHQKFTDEIQRISLIENTQKTIALPR